MQHNLDVRICILAVHNRIIGKRRKRTGDARTLGAVTRLALYG